MQMIKHLLQEKNLTKASKEQEQIFTVFSFSFFLLLIFFLQIEIPQKTNTIFVP